MSILTYRTSPPPGPATIWNQTHQIGSDFHVGEDIEPARPVYEKTSDGLIYMCGGSGVASLSAEGGHCLGFAAERGLVGQSGPITVVDHLDFGLFDKTGANAVAIGTLLYIHFATAAKGRYDTVPTFAGQLPVGEVISKGRARLKASMYAAGVAQLFSRVYGEVPTGLLNGANTAYVIAQTPQAGSVSVYMGATDLTLARVNPTQYTVNTVTKTITMAVAPTNGYKMVVDYSRAS